MVDASLVCSDGRTFPVRDGFVLGRVTGCDLVIDDGKCSRRHARICVEGSVVEIEDLQSSNGTLLNGKPVQRRMLRDGDQIQIGKTVIAYREGVIAPKAAAAPVARPAGPAAAPAAAAAEDDDLFGDAPPPPKATPPAAKPPVAAAADEDDDLFGSAPAPSPKAPAPPPAPVRPAAPTPSAPPPRPAQVVEFADEVVQVRATPQPKAVAPAAAAGEPKVESKQRVLQFQKHGAGRGPLGDDLAQMPGSTKALLFGAVLAAAAGLVWLMIWLVR
jgi:predicted component of type VI protein secretion system